MISIIIPFKGSEEKAKMLTNLLEQIIEDKSKVPCEIIIINSSKDLNLRDVLVYENIKIIQSDVNVGAARNLGVKEAKGDFLLFIDADCSVPSGFIDHVYDLITKVGDDVGAIGGPVECVPTTSIIQKYLDYSIFTPFPRYQNDYTADWKTFHKHHHPNTCNLAVKRRVFEIIGGFWDGEGEDVYFLLKMSRNGYKIRYYSCIKVFHHHPRKINELMHKYFRMGKSAARLLLTFPTSPLMVQRLLRFSFFFLPAIFMAFLFPLLLFLFPYGILLAYYVERVRSLRAALLYPLLDILLQLLYSIGFLTSLIKELYLRVRKWIRR